LNAFKRKHRSAFPVLRWQFVAFGHNEHEISAAKRKAHDLGMDFFVKLTWDEEFSPFKNRELVQIATGSHSRSEFYERHGFDYARHIRTQLWAAPVFNWDGRGTGCSRNFWGEFGGNAFVGGLKGAWARRRME